ncbi:MAG TPA: hypothetical protein VJY47_01130 [Candidatus Dojkabacteria bacterium]|nr:hypothetical protein [Candidatus Dojkabacteria bacterium]
MTKVKTIQKPQLTEKQRDILLKTPLHKRIGLSLKEYNNEDILKVQEKEFAQRFTDLGYSIRWISRAQPSKNGGYIPTNDFEWNGIEWELKRPLKQSYGSISGLIKKGVISGKKNYVIDLKGASLEEKVARQLSMYNKRNKGKEISKLLIFDKGGLKEIILKE